MRRTVAAGLVSAVLLGWGVASVGLPGAVRSPPGFVSPDRGYAIVLVSDTAFGQVEILRVVAGPDTPGARVIFEQRGDTPPSFVGWRDAATAELAFPPQGDAAGHRMLLRCLGKACRLDPA